MSGQPPPEKCKKKRSGDKYLREMLSKYEQRRIELDEQATTKCMHLEALERIAPAFSMAKVLAAFGHSGTQAHDLLAMLASTQAPFPSAPRRPQTAHVRVAPTAPIVCACSSSAPDMHINSYDEDDDDAFDECQPKGRKKMKRKNTELSCACTSISLMERDSDSDADDECQPPRNDGEHMKVTSKDQLEAIKKLGVLVCNRNNLKNRIKEKESRLKQIQTDEPKSRDGKKSKSPVSSKDVSTPKNVVDDRLKRLEDTEIELINKISALEDQINNRVETKPKPKSEVKLVEDKPLTATPVTLQAVGKESEIHIPECDCKECLCKDFKECQKPKTESTPATTTSPDEITPSAPTTSPDKTTPSTPTTDPDECICPPAVCVCSSEDIQKPKSETLTPTKSASKTAETAKEEAEITPPPPQDPNEGADECVCEGVCICKEESKTDQPSTAAPSQPTEKDDCTCGEVCVCPEEKPDENNEIVPYDSEAVEPGDLESRVRRLETKERALTGQINDLRSSINSGAELSMKLANDLEATKQNLFMLRLNEEVVSRVGSRTSYVIPFDTQNRVSISKNEEEGIDEVCPLEGEADSPDGMDETLPTATPPQPPEEDCKPPAVTQSIASIDEEKCTCSECVCDKDAPPELPNVDEDCTCDVCDCDKDAPPKVSPPPEPLKVDEDCTCNVCDCDKDTPPKVAPPPEPPKVEEDCTCNVCDCDKDAPPKVSPPPEPPKVNLECTCKDDCNCDNDIPTKVTTSPELPKVDEKPPPEDTTSPEPPGVNEEPPPEDTPPSQPPKVGEEECNCGEICNCAEKGPNDNNQIVPYDAEAIEPGDFESRLRGMETRERSLVEQINELKASLHTLGEVAMKLNNDLEATKHNLFMLRLNDEVVSRVDLARGSRASYVFPFDTQNRKSITEEVETDLSVLHESEEVVAAECKEEETPAEDTSPVEKPLGEDLNPGEGGEGSPDEKPCTKTETKPAEESCNLESTKSVLTPSGQLVALNFPDPSEYNNVMLPTSFSIKEVGSCPHNMLVKMEIEMEEDNESEVTSVSSVFEPEEFAEKECDKTELSPQKADKCPERCPKSAGEEQKPEKTEKEPEEEQVAGEENVEEGAEPAKTEGEQPGEEVNVEDSAEPAGTEGEQPAEEGNVEDSAEPAATEGEQPAEEGNVEDSPEPAATEGEQPAEEGNVEDSPEPAAIEGEQPPEEENVEDSAEPAATEGEQTPEEGNVEGSADPAATEGEQPPEEGNVEDSAEPAATEGEQPPEEGNVEDSTEPAATDGVQPTEAEETVEETPNLNKHELLIDVEKPESDVNLTVELQTIEDDRNKGTQTLMILGASDKPNFPSASQELLKTPTEDEATCCQPPVTEESPEQEEVKAEDEAPSEEPTAEPEDIKAETKDEAPPEEPPESEEGKAQAEAEATSPEEPTSEEQPEAEEVNAEAEAEATPEEPPESVEAEAEAEATPEEPPESVEAEAEAETTPEVPPESVEAEVEAEATPEEPPESVEAEAEATPEEPPESVEAEAEAEATPEVPPESVEAEAEAEAIPEEPPESVEAEAEAEANPIVEPQEAEEVKEEAGDEVPPEESVEVKVEPEDEAPPADKPPQSEEVREEAVAEATPAPLSDDEVYESAEDEASKSQPVSEDDGFTSAPEDTPQEKDDQKRLESANERLTRLSAEVAEIKKEIQKMNQAREERRAARRAKQTKTAGPEPEFKMNILRKAGDDGLVIGWSVPPGAKITAFEILLDGRPQNIKPEPGSENTAVIPSVNLSKECTITMHALENGRRSSSASAKYTPSS